MIFLEHCVQLCVQSLNKFFFFFFRTRAKLQLSDGYTSVNKIYVENRNIFWTSNMYQTLLRL